MGATFVYGMIPVYSDPHGSDPRVDRIATLRSAAADDAPSPLFELAGALLAEGKLEESLLLHARAALAGHDGAQVEYGRMLLFGIGCEPDPQLALGWLAQAESQHHPVASYWLAWVAMGSVLLPRDERMNQRLRVAVNHDYPPALRAAALHYGRRPGAADQAACIHLLERAARRGDLVAALLLAERLQRGEGCAVQPQAAASWRAWLRERQVEPLPPTVAPASRFDGASPGHGEPAPLALEDALNTPSPHLLCSEPRVAQVDAVLSSDECRLLIAMAMLNAPGGGAVVPALRIDPAQEDLALRVLQLRLARSAQAELAHAEAIEVERRIPGSPDWRHRDYLAPDDLARDRPDAGNRRRTLCVCLHAPEAGGGHEFPFGLVETRAIAGSAVVVDNLMADGRPDPYSMHAGIAVERGEQWQATLRLRERRYRPF